MEEYDYLPLPSGGIDPNRFGFIRKATKDMLPHELEFLKEIEGMHHNINFDQTKLDNAVSKLFAANKAIELNNVNT